ncbi:dehydrogenase [Kordiimonas sediminis]|uniref:Dehydrogenase n=1 Tax=Kordiimonas sediminis TaxID=1735581 RepID=A0A919AWP7_9PROT|nr:SDR family NAD(P)-dependent oxidoreductase [Kordiimonas sediminis]GHF26727.1 dehydrogenase [Kordiimonas sediminis]
MAKSMEVKDKTIIVTGAASGIGKALAERFAQEGAKAVAVVDLDIAGAELVAQSIGDQAKAFQLDVTDEGSVKSVVARVTAWAGPVDLYFSNAGIAFSDAPDWTAISQTNEQWQKIWEVNVFSHILALRAVLPDMIERGNCGFMITASAAGLLSQIGDTAYSTTKHAALGLAESVAITHGDDLYVGVLCPQAVVSKMTEGAEGSSAALDGIMPAEELAEKTVAAMKDGQFMIRPHAQVESYFQNKAANHDRWVGGMRKLRRNVMDATGRPI